MTSGTEGRNAESRLVSVIIPTCNRRAMLEKCLDALRRQTYPDYELIVVDDCSTDDTAQFLRDFAERHPQLRFRTFRNARHAGANPSRNRGVRAASGAFVAFLDSDCIARKDWLQNLMRGFTSQRVAAVSGCVHDVPPRNIYELTVKGTHRLHRAGAAHRLVAGNMCIRRQLLLEYGLDEDRSRPLRDRHGRPDVSVSGRGDEEGLFLVLRAAGYEQRVVLDAVVLHDHRLNGKTFVRQAFRGGRSAARLVYKFHLPPRLDLAPFLLTYLTLPLVSLAWWLAVLPPVFFGAALAAITYNDRIRKGKTLGETIRSFPMLLLYYHVRLGGYVLETSRLHVTRHSLQRVRLNEYARTV
jgi:glycosyltransferase involved in cell wall biosynthesis